MEKELNEADFQDLRKPRTLSSPAKESFGSCITRVKADLMATGMKEETATKIAQKRCSALKDIGNIEEDQEIKKNDALGSEAPIESRQTAFMQALLHITTSLGQWDQGFGSDGSHYLFQSDNVFKDMGIACRNCVFFRPSASCEIVRGIIQRDGLCRLWIIPEGAINPDPEVEVPRVSEKPDPAGDSLSPEEREQVASVDSIGEGIIEPDSLAAVLKEGELRAAGIKQEKDERK